MDALVGVSCLLKLALYLGWMIVQVSGRRFVFNCDGFLYVAYTRGWIGEELRGGGGVDRLQIYI